MGWMTEKLQLNSWQLQETVQTSSGAMPVSFSVGTVFNFPGDKAAVWHLLSVVFATVPPFVLSSMWWVSHSCEASGQVMCFYFLDCWCIIYSLKPKHYIGWLTLLRIQQCLGQNLCPGNKCPGWGGVWFSWVHPDFRVSHNYFFTSSNSLITNDPVI